MRTIWVVAGIGAVSALTSCADFALGGCTEELRAGLSIRVATEDGTPICDAKVTAIDGVYREELEHLGLGTDCSYSGAWEREGNYRIEVSRRGFEPAAIDELEVEGDACHVDGETAFVTLSQRPGCDGLGVPGIRAIIKRPNGERICDAEVRATGEGPNPTTEIFEAAIVELGCGYQGAIDQTGRFEVAVRATNTSERVMNVEVTGDDCKLSTETIDVTVP